MTKRQKFVITSILLSLGFLGINFLDNQYRFWAIGGLSLLTILGFIWGLWEGLDLDATLLTLILPGLFTLGVGIFWFLLPTIFIARIPVILMYGLGIYALALTSNIYTVSAIRTIALMRAAKGVGFVLTLLTSFLVFDAVFSLRVNLAFVLPLVLMASFLLILQGLWVSDLDHKLSLPLIKKALVLSFGVTQVAALLFFWPVTVVVGSLFLTVAVYVLLGLGQASVEGRLFKTTVREYLTIGVVVFIAMFFATSW
ncbi:hypothetical protein KW795_02130 [Candidatus Microgenomates bacterium]|nr:hypothetical protein [Candidatus Microgenomates bacterium]